MTLKEFRERTNLDVEITGDEFKYIMDNLK